jgi:hypothetical protein
VLRQVGDQVRRRLLAAQEARLIPRGSVGQFRERRQLQYAVTACRDLRTGVVSAASNSDCGKRLTKMHPRKVATLR